MLYGISRYAKESEVGLATMPQSPNPPAPPLAQRVLEAMHPVCSHDLPNQVVALQSLLQLFAWDEAANLSPQGREYFERLQSVAGKTVAYVQFLKEMARLARQTPQIESLRVPHLVAEVSAEVQRLHPDHVWTWQCRLDVEDVRADRRLVHKGLLHFLRVPVLLGLGATTIEMHTAAQPGHVAWNIAASPASGAAPACSEAALLEKRLELMLAQAYWAAADIVCRPVEGPAAGVTKVSLVVPNRPSHG